MSSNTTFYAAPAAPPPPPVITNTIGGQAASTCTAKILGEGGCRLLRRTLAGLAAGTAPVLARIPAGEAGKVAREAFHGWKADPSDPERFTKTIQGREVAVEARTTLTTSFRFTVQTQGVAMPVAEQQRLAADFQRVVNRTVNTVLAVTVAEQATERVRETAKTKVQVEMTTRQGVVGHRIQTSTTIR